MTDEFDGGRSPLVGAGAPASRQVSWFSTYEFAQQYAADHGGVLDHDLIAGTPQWCDMADDNARKLLAVILGGVRDALRNDTYQAELAESSREIARTTDCTGLARRIQHGRDPAYIARRKENA